MARLGTCARAFAVLLATACTGREESSAVHAEDAGPDADADAAIADASGGAPSLDVSQDPYFDIVCPQKLTDCQPWADEIVSASIFGVSRFVAIDRDRILAERTTATGTEPVVVHLSNAIAELDTPEPLEPRDIADRWVLLCKPPLCSLYRVPESETELVPVVAGEVPPGFEPVGIALMGEPGSPCVYGKGVACFSGTSWDELVPASGSVFRAADAVADALWLAGDAGRIVRADPSGWTEYPSTGPVTLTAISASGQYVAIGGENGALQIFGDASLGCQLGTKPLLSLQLSSTGISVLTADGTAYRSWNKSTWCSTQPFAALALVDVGRGCEIGAGKRAITQDAAYVEGACPVP